MISSALRRRGLLACYHTPTTSPRMLQTLPNDLLQRITEWLDGPSLCSLASACREHSLPNVWKTLGSRDLLFATLTAHYENLQASWRNLFLMHRNFRLITIADHHHLRRLQTPPSIEEFRFTLVLSKYCRNKRRIVQLAARSCTHDDIRLGAEPEWRSACTLHRGRDDPVWLDGALPTRGGVSSITRSIEALTLEVYVTRGHRTAVIFRGHGRRGSADPLYPDRPIPCPPDEDCFGFRDGWKEFGEGSETSIEWYPQQFGMLGLMGGRGVRMIAYSMSRPDAKFQQTQGEPSELDIYLELLHSPSGHGLSDALPLLMEKYLEIATEPDRFIGRMMERYCEDVRSGRAARA